ncbi:tRNA (adenosine(37)-N6)-threonylcarbamoyltransferase complex dimerization subunit type 1 TsaB [bacterium]|nr:tRNA (adenosine(37)-N6)-threonylcarbamoyltransferase complex dimerization subunit type 1 TsaB [bacterium]
MIVLGIETATPVCGVSLAGEHGLMAEYRMVRDRNHAEFLATLVESVCQVSGTGLECLQAVAVSIGPGSFTGLRIGLGYAKGLAFGLDVPLVAVPTLEAMLWNIPPVCPWACVLLWARQGEAYRGLFQWIDNQWVTVRKTDLVTENDIGKDLPDREMLFIGDAAEHFQPVLRESGYSVFMDSLRREPGAFSVASLGRRKAMNGEIAEPDSLVPQYIKRFRGVE